MKALILAAGFGSRLMPLTKDQPKCMVNYQNKRLIDYEMNALKEAGINDIAVVGGYLSDVLKGYLNLAKNRFFINENYATTNMTHTLFCAREFLQTCIEDGQDLIVSYADIVYFAPTIKALAKANGWLNIVVDEAWLKLWQRRFENPLDDAESLKFNEKGKICELGKKASSLDEIKAQYIGLFKISHEFLPKLIEFYDDLDKGAKYDGKDFYNMYMTSFLQGLIDKFGEAFAVKINGGWCEIDFKSDLEIDIFKL